MTEREYIEQILTDPQNGVVRSEYAKFLEDQGDLARAEFVRLTLEGGHEKRLQELAKNLHPSWLVIVGNPEIQGCGNETRRVSPFVNKWRLSFDLICDKNWAQLTPSDNDKIRYCEECKKEVHWCATLGEARTNARHNRCIAVDVGIPRKENDLTSDMAVFGNPSEDSLIENDYYGVDEVSLRRLKGEKIKDSRTVDAPWQQDEME